MRFIKYQYLLVVGLIVNGLILQSQNEINRYEYWFNNDYLSKVTTNIAPVTILELNSAIPTSSLQFGLHSFNIRFQDANGMWSNTVSQLFYKLAVSSHTNSQLVEYEYWFNNDYASKVTTTIGGNATETILTDIATSTLPSGLHSFNIRFKDANGLWSSTISQLFYKQATASPANSQLVEYEYWFNTDYASKVTTTLGGNDTETILTDISTSTLPSGLHSFNIRFKDANGMWSSTVSQMFYKQATANPTNSQLVEYEYWFNTDYASKVTTTLGGNDTETILTDIATSTLPSGLHSFNIRFKDANGMWSSTVSQYFYKIPVLDISNSIVTYRYWLNNDFAQATTVNLQSPASFFSLLDDINFSHIPHGQYVIHFQFKDSLGNWSVVTTDTIDKISLPIADFIASENNICLGETVNFTSLSVDADYHLWDFGDGNFSSDSVIFYTYSSPGIYTVSLTVGDTITNADSTVFMNITVNAHTTSVLNEIACDSYTLNGQTYTSSGTYVQTLQNMAGCDSTLTLNLTVLYSTSSVINETACDSYTLNGQTYTSSGTYIQTIQNAVGCDSIITLNLTIHSVDTSITHVNNTLTANASFAQYQWLDCNNNYNPIPGETNQTFIPMINGSFAVQVMQNGCIDTSFCYNVIIINIPENIKGQGISVFPNPTDGFVRVNLDTLCSDIKITINDITGRTIKQFTCSNMNYIDIEMNVPAGTYFVSVCTGNKTFTIPIIRN